MSRYVGKCIDNIADKYVYSNVHKYIDNEIDYHLRDGQSY